MFLIIPAALNISTTVQISKVLFFQLGRKLETSLRVVYLLKSRLATRVSEAICASVRVGVSAFSGILFGLLDWIRLDCVVSCPGQNVVCVCGRR